MSVPVKVLLVEDNPADAELLIHEIRRAGFEPDFRRIDQADELPAALDPSLDLILSDYQLPQFNGLQVIKRVRAAGLDVPIIVVSGTIGEDMAVAAIQAGADDYLLKDRLTRLGLSITNALEQRRLRQEKRATEEKIQGLSRFNAGVLNSLTAHICVLDETGTLLAVN